MEGFIFRKNKIFAMAMYRTLSRDFEIKFDWLV
jgi:hypothetical protein